MGAQCERGWDVKCYKRPFFHLSLTFKCKLGIFLLYTLEKHTSQRLSQYTHIVHTETQTFTGCEDETDIYKTSQAEGGMWCLVFTSKEPSCTCCILLSVQVMEETVIRKYVLCLSQSLKALEHMRIKTLWRWIDLQLLEWLRFVIRCVKCIVVH